MDKKPETFRKKTLKLPRYMDNWLILWVMTFSVLGLILESIDLFLPGAWGISAAGSPAFPAIFIVSVVVSAVSLGIWRFIRWVRFWRNFRRFLFVAACIATLVALFYAEEDWRGKHDWEKFKGVWEAKGEHFDFARVVPPPVPDDENFAMAPIFDTTSKLASRKWRDTHRNRQSGRGGWQSEWDTNLVDQLEMNVTPDNEDPPKSGTGNWVIARKSDLEVWQNYYRALGAKANAFPVPSQPKMPAQDVLLALSKYDLPIEELRQAGERPYSRFPLDYDDENPGEILLPHLATLKKCSIVLALRAIAELQNGQGAKALDDVKLNLRLVDSIRTEPFIITHLVRIAILQIDLQAIWEGLAEHVWSDAQLADLDSALAKLDFLADYKLSVRGELAAHVKLIDYMEQKRSRYWEISGMMSDAGETRDNNTGDLPLAIGLHLMPKGWFYQSDIVLAAGQLQLNLSVDDGQQIVSPVMAHRQDSFAEFAAHPTPFDFIARLLLPALGGYVKKAAYGQNSVNLARGAIALERYRLAQGEFPESLGALAPRFISEVPHDIINGKSLHYRRTEDGQFVLYSVGWNETDDGGVVVMKQHSKTDVDRDQGDWVWRYAREKE